MESTIVGLTKTNVALISDNDDLREEIRQLKAKLNKKQQEYDELDVLNNTNKERLERAIKDYIDLNNGFAQLRRESIDKRFKYEDQISQLHKQLDDAKK